MLLKVLQLFLNSEFLSFQVFKSDRVGCRAFFFGLNAFVEFAVALGQFFNPALQGHVSSSFLLAVNPLLQDNHIWPR